MANATIPAFETVTTDSLQVVCDGGAQGHPRVFLHIDHDRGEITCPYCSKKYLYQPGKHAAA